MVSQIPIFLFFDHSYYLMPCYIFISNWDLYPEQLFELSRRCELTEVKFSGLYCTFVAIVQIIWEVWIIEGQIIWAILYM